MSVIFLIGTVRRRAREEYLQIIDLVRNRQGPSQGWDQQTILL